MMNVKERTDALLSVKSFSICKAPVTVIRDFKDFCRVETKDDYSLGLKLLMERNKASFQQEAFAMKIQEIEGRLIDMETKGVPEVEEKPKFKTFGRKQEVKKDEQAK